MSGAIGRAADRRCGLRGRYCAADRRRGLRGRQAAPDLQDGAAAAVM